MFVFLMSQAAVYDLRLFELKCENDSLNHKLASSLKKNRELKTTLEKKRDAFASLCVKVRGKHEINSLS